MFENKEKPKITHKILKEEPGIVPEITNSFKEKLERDIPQMRRDLDTMAAQYSFMRDHYPEVFDNMTKKNPDLNGALDKAAFALNILGDHNFFLSNSAVREAIQNYNLGAHVINKVLATFFREEQESAEQKRVSAIHGELEVNENDFTAAEKKELRIFVKEMWDSLFPPSYTDRFVKWAADQSDLEGYQKILLAPANGIEGAVLGLVKLTEAKTYRDLSDGLKHAQGMSYKEWCDAFNALKFTYENVDTSDKIAPVISIICGISFLFGGIKTISGLSKLKSFTKLQPILAGTLLPARAATFYGNRAGKLIPAMTAFGVSLKYLPEN